MSLVVGCEEPAGGSCLDRSQIKTGVRLRLNSEHHVKQIFPGGRGPPSPLQELEVGGHRSLYLLVINTHVRRTARH